MKHPPSKFCSKATLDKHPEADSGLLAKCTVDEMTPALQEKQYAREEICAKTMRTINCIDLATFNRRSIPPDPKFKSTMTN